MEKFLLSICIALHNRSNVVSEHIDDLLCNEDSRFDIIVSDSSDEGKDLLSIRGVNSERVKIYRIPSDTPAMQNWKSSLDHADGVFCFHLNDRDILHANHLSDFLDFLETHIDCKGGICRHITTYQEPQVFVGKNEALMSVPYFASHPTGIVFNTSRYQLLEDLDSIFDKDAGVHPHDIILGKLSQLGELFIYTDNIWNLASNEFYAMNPSGFEKSKKSMFFEPNERLYELKQNIIQLGELDFSEDIKQQKIEQMIKTYLGLSTNAYFYVLESDHETAHYGIEKEMFGLRRRYKFSMDVLDMFDKE